MLMLSQMSQRDTGCDELVIAVAGIMRSDGKKLGLVEAAIAGFYRRLSRKANCQDDEQRLVVAAGGGGLVKRRR